MNIWIPDGMKDITVDRLAPRQRLLAALDEVISEKLNPAHHIDAVESKLFGIGAESYTVGSNEFYMGYATSRQTALCLDATKITSGKSFIESPFIAGNVINVKEFGERNKMKKVGGDWIKTDEKERIVKKWDVY